jgi:hypothetical protein
LAALPLIEPRGGRPKLITLVADKGYDLTWTRFHQAEEHHPVTPGARVVSGSA